MTSGPETRIVKKITEALEARGCIVVKIHGSAYMPKGFPDLVVVRPDGVTAYVEVKQPGRTDGPQGNGVTMKQCEWLWRLGEQGCIVGWAASVSEALGVVFG